MEGETIKQELQCKSINDLKVMLRRANVDYSDCYEKSDLIEKILNTGAHLAPEGMKHNCHVLPLGPSTKHNVSIGELNCSVVQNSSHPDLIVVLSHGYGADAKDLVPIAENVVLPIIRKGKVHTLRDGTYFQIKFVFPNAPLQLPQGGLAWWPLDLQQLMFQYMTGQINKIVESAPPEFMESSRQIRTVIEALSREHGLPVSKFIVGGFSQGAMVSVDVCLKLEESVAALVPWSAGYMNAVEWRQLAPNKKDLKVDKVDFTSPQVYQSHGTEDQVIPFQIGSLLKEEIFEKNGFTLNFQSFGSGHSIPNEVIKTFVDLITSHLN